MAKEMNNMLHAERPAAAHKQCAHHTQLEETSGTAQSPTKHQSTLNEAQILSNTECMQAIININMNQTHTLPSQQPNKPAQLVTGQQQQHRQTLSTRC
jgi:hypothetical protein